MRFVMRHLRHSRVRSLAGAAIAVLAFTATAVAGDGSYKLRATTAGNAAAQATTLSKADVGTGWTGGPTKPDLSAPGCPGFHPKTSDIVLTGAAATKYDDVGMRVESDSEVMRTEKMLKLDWHRTVESPRFMPCLRSILAKSTDAKAKFVSLRRMTLPAIARYTLGLRIVIDVTTKSGKIRMVSDLVAVGDKSTEIVLTTTMPLASVPTLFPNELVWAKMLAGRIRA
jgi:hypothetical protein